MKKFLLSSCLIAVTLFASVGKMDAATFTYSSTLAGLPVNATIDAVFSLNTLTITASGMTANPTSVIQALSGIDFTVSGGLTGSLTSVSGQLISIAADKSYSNVSGTPVWTKSGSTFETNALPSPNHLLIGAPNASNTYSAANGGIAGNNAHNPFVSQLLTLVYNINGATANSSLTSLTLEFGTAFDKVSIPTREIPAVNPVPEPSTAVFAIAGFGALAFWRARKK